MGRKLGAIWVFNRRIPMTKLLYQGHGSFRLTSDAGVVLFLDPFVGEGYDEPADIILISHQHEDHNKIELITQKPNCEVITNVEALADGKHNTFSIKGIEIEAVEAEDANHPIDQCVGFIITVDGLKLYFSCDTARTKQMETFAARDLDFAFLCADGFYNMDLVEAAQCAELIGAKHNTPVHLKPGELFDREMAEQFNAPNRAIFDPGEEVELN